MKGFIAGIPLALLVAAVQAEDMNRPVSPSALTLYKELTNMKCAGWLAL